MILLKTGADSVSLAYYSQRDSPGRCWHCQPDGVSKAPLRKGGILLGSVYFWSNCRKGSPLASNKVGSREITIRKIPKRYPKPPGTLWSFINFLTVFDHLFDRVPRTLGFATLALLPSFSGCCKNSQ
jgi:hypothetical protein